MTALFALAIGVFIGWLLTTVKMWNCILESWRTRDIRLKLAGQEAHDPHYELGWLEAHRDLVRELDASPWVWMVRKQRVVKEVVDEP